MKLAVLDLALGFAVPIGVAALIGLERERGARAARPSDFGGIRTFPLIAMMGSVGALMAERLGSLGLVAPFGALVVLLGLAYARQLGEAARPGLTTEFAAVLVFCFGALPFLDLGGLVMRERLVVVGALGAVVMALLALKEPLHALSARVNREDLYATVRFVLLAAVVLPLLPDATWDPYDALNPRKIGIVVVLIAGVSFFGYVAVRLLGTRRGIGITAAFGGLVSSTAVTLAFSERTKREPSLARVSSLAIVIASTIMFPRILLLVAAIEPTLVPHLAPVLGAMLLTAAIGCLWLWWYSGHGAGASTDVQQTKFSNPFSLKAAIKLGLAYAVVRLIAAVAHHLFGSGGLLVSAGLAGTTDVDAITISVSRMNQSGAADARVAVLAIVIAAISNTLVKTALARLIGGSALGGLVALSLLPAAGAGLLAWLLL